MIEDRIEEKISEEDYNSSIYDKYSIKDNTVLSDLTKSYINSHININRPELSDFSKQFLSANVGGDYSNRPELSNITRAYLISHSPVDNDEN